MRVHDVFQYEHVEKCCCFFPEVIKGHLRVVIQKPDLDVLELLLHHKVTTGMVVTARKTCNFLGKPVFFVMCVLSKEKYPSCLKSLRVLQWD